MTVQKCSEGGCLIPGSYDPITLGHVNIIERAARLFSPVYVGLFENKAKRYMFAIDARVRMLEKAVAHVNGVHVIVSAGLVVDFARELGIPAIVRGLRDTRDYELEKQLAAMNADLAPGIETVFVPTQPRFAAVSSSVVRELISFGVDVSAYVPECVIQELQNR